MDDRRMSPWVEVVRLAPVVDIVARRRLTSGDLVKVAEKLRDVQEILAADGSLWQEKTMTAAAAAQVECTMGARAVQELRAASNGNAA